MRQLLRIGFVIFLSVAVLAVPVLSSVQASTFFGPIGCQADGFCNALCAFDPDCGSSGCVHNAPCASDADCQPLGFCAVYRLCVCTG